MRTKKRLFHSIPIYSYKTPNTLNTRYFTYSIQFAIISTSPEILPYKEYSYYDFYVDLRL